MEADRAETASIRAGRSSPCGPLLGERSAARTGVVEVHTGGERLQVISSGGALLRIEGDATRRAAVVVEGDPGLLLAVASGTLTLTEAVGRGLQVRGNRALAGALLQPASPPPHAGAGLRSPERVDSG